VLRMCYLYCESLKIQLISFICCFIEILYAYSSDGMMTGFRLVSREFRCDSWWQQETFMGLKTSRLFLYKHWDNLTLIIYLYLCALLQIHSFLYPHLVVLSVYFFVTFFVYILFKELLGRKRTHARARACVRVCVCVCVGGGCKFF